jgi:8-oxo-dGTP diphosphatase
MPRRSPPARGIGRPLSVSVDVIAFTPHDGELAVALARIAGARGRDRWAVPSDVVRGDESLDDAALRIARDALGAAPPFLEQIVTLGGARKSLEAAQVSVVYLALAAESNPSSRGDLTWTVASELPPLVGRHRDAIEHARTAMRARLDQQPIAFRLLPASFTLSELQAIYELLLGRRLHKASFRRSLHAAALVEAIDEWRGEGRGRPAQLFRYVAPKRRRSRRSVRFDSLT